MVRNKMANVAGLLGVRLYEEFYIENIPLYTYRFTEKCLEAIGPNGQWMECNKRLIDLLNGKCFIKHFSSDLEKKEDTPTRSNMQKVADMLGVKLYEVFRSKPEKFCCSYRLTEKQLEICREGGSWEKSDAIFDFLRGDLAVRKMIQMPYIPSQEEEYWFITRVTGSFPDVSRRIWQEGILDLTLYAAGNCFQTMEEAKWKAVELEMMLQKVCFGTSGSRHA